MWLADVRKTNSFGPRPRRHRHIVPNIVELRECNKPDGLDPVTGVDILGISNEPNLKTDARDFSGERADDRVVQGSGGEYLVGTGSGLAEALHSAAERRRRHIQTRHSESGPLS